MCPKAMVWRDPADYAGPIFQPPAKPVQKREEGWQGWLQDAGILDTNMSEEALYHRYELFKNVTFEAVDRQDWPRYYQDLLPFKSSFV